MIGLPDRLAFGARAIRFVQPGQPPAVQLFFGFFPAAQARVDHRFHLRFPVAGQFVKQGRIKIRHVGQFVNVRIRLID